MILFLHKYHVGKKSGLNVPMRTVLLLGKASFP